MHFLAGRKRTRGVKDDDDAEAPASKKAAENGENATSSRPKRGARK